MRIFKLNEENRIYYAVVISILLHFGIFWSYVSTKILIADNNNPAGIEEEFEQRLVFDIVESDPNFEINSLNEQAELASDKNTIASDFTPDNNPLGIAPNTEGIPDIKELPKQQISIENLLKKNEQKVDEKFKIEDEDGGINVKKEQEKQEEQYEKILNNTQRLASTNAVPDNRFSNAPDLGGLSLSTYKWDFAPYMLELKRRIDNNMNPPAAFTILGIISGKYVIQFVITKEGNLKRMQVLDYQGSEKLMDTSINSIRYSFPFKPLPDNFPDEELVVTGHFQFTIRRK